MVDPYGRASEPQEQESSDSLHRTRSLSREGDPGAYKPPPREEERRLLRVNALTRRFEEADRLIQRQVTQHVERRTRITKPYNIQALAHGEFAKTTSRVAYDIERIAEGGSLANRNQPSPGQGTTQGTETYAPVTLGHQNGELMSVSEYQRAQPLLEEGQTLIPSGEGFEFGAVDSGTEQMELTELLNTVRRMAHGDPTLL